MIRIFVRTSGVVLVVTGLAKLVAAMGAAPVLGDEEPVIAIVANRHLFLILGLLEVAAGAYCFFCKNLGLGVAVCAWLATNFAAYRLLAVIFPSVKPCPCVGHITDALGIDPSIADRVMQIVFLFLLLGSFACAIHLWIFGTGTRASCVTVMGDRARHVENREMPRVR